MIKIGKDTTQVSYIDVVGERRQIIMNKADAYHLKGELGYVVMEAEDGRIFVDRIFDIAFMARNLKALIMSYIGDNILKKITFYDYGLSSYVPASMNFTEAIQVTFQNLIAKTVDISRMNLSSIIDASSLFSGNRNIEEVIGLHLPNATNLYGLFQNCNNLKHVNDIQLSNTLTLDTQYMFAFCSQLQSDSILDCTNLKITNQGYMYWGCPSLTTFPNYTALSAQCTDAQYMFASCTNLQSFSDLNLSSTNKLQNISYMFGYCENITDITLSVSYVTQSTGTFAECYKLRNLSNVSVTASNLTELDISDTVIDMSYGFLNALTSNTHSPHIKLSFDQVRYIDETLYNKVTGRGWTVSPEPLLGNTMKISITSDFTSAEQSVTLTGDITANNTAIDNALTQVLRRQTASNQVNLKIVYYGNITQLSISAMLNNHRGIVKYYDFEEFDLTRVSFFNNAFANETNLYQLTIKRFPNNLEDSSNMFYNCTNLEAIFGNAKMEGITKSVNMFYDCPKLALPYIDMENITTNSDAENMFYNCNSYSWPPLIYNCSVSVDISASDYSVNASSYYPLSSILTKNVNAGQTCFKNEYNQNPVLTVSAGDYTYITTNNLGTLLTSIGWTIAQTDGAH